MFKLEYRDNQVELAKTVVDHLSQVDNVIISAPTGSGKSILAYLIHEEFFNRRGSHKSVILNHNNSLVQQYDSSIGTLSGTVSIKGRENYTCVVSRDSVAASVCMMNRCIAKQFCAYYEKRSKFVTSPLAITNYQLIFSYLDAGKLPRSSDLIICDECHNIESIVVDYKSVRVNHGLINLAEKGLEFADKFNLEGYRDLITAMNTVYDKWDDKDHVFNFYAFYEYLKELFLLIIKNIPLEGDDAETFKNKHKKEFMIYLKIIQEFGIQISKFRNFDELRDETTFIYEKNEFDSGIEYLMVPLFVDKMFQSIFRKVANKAVYMSATISNIEIFKQELGIDSGNAVFLDLPSTFPPENRKSIFLPVHSLNYNNSKSGAKEFNEVCDTMYDLIKEHAKKKDSGAILVPSYSMARDINKYLQDKLEQLGYSIIMNVNAKERESSLKEFLEKDGRMKICISPSFAEGVNMADDSCRFIMIPKHPYLSLGSKRIKARMDLDRGWYIAKSMDTMIQQSGRAVRHDKDWSTTYILDTQSLTVYKGQKKYLPQWFNEAVEICQN